MGFNPFAAFLPRLSMDLGRSLRQALAKFTGAPVADEKAVKALCRELQRVLISSDVNVRLVFELTKKIENRALDAKLRPGLSLREHVVKVVYEELASMMGEQYEPSISPHKILLLGLYGGGKTTTAGKLAHFYKCGGSRSRLSPATRTGPRHTSSSSRSPRIPAHLLRHKRGDRRAENTVRRQGKGEGGQVKKKSSRRTPSSGGTMV